MERRKQNANDNIAKLILSLALVMICVTISAQIEIASPEQLDSIRENLSGDYVLMRDIDMREFGNWEPIGWHDTPFTGTFDGRGNEIRNLRVEVEEGDAIGLFGAASGDRTVIRNVHLVDVHILMREGRHASGLVGSTERGVTIEGCSVTGEINGANTVGGIVGRVYGSSTVLQCFFEGTVSGRECVGGLAARVENESRVSQCYVNAEVSGLLWVGGITGYLGRPEQLSSISDCYASGSVTSERDAGGIVGNNERGLINCCYSNAYIEGHDELKGGLVGFLGAEGETIASFWDTEASSTGRSQGGEGRSTTQMTSQDNYPGRWDFREVWAIENGETYPYLRFQEQPGEHNYPAMGAPSSLVGETGDRTITLTWEEPSSGVWIRYNIYREGDRHAQVGADETEFIDRNVDNYTPYSYYVKAVWEDQSESRATNTVTVIAHEPFAGGNGTVENPYQISTPQQLSDVRFHRSSHYIQTANINLDIAPWNRGWEVIGYYFSNMDYESFSGSYNGNGFIINGMLINSPGINYRGLFAYLQGGTVENVILENADIFGGTYLGGIAGAMAGESLIKNCQVSGEIEGSNFIGGIVASQLGGDVIDCISRGSIIGTSGTIGGVVGKNDSNDAGVIRGCECYANIVGGHQFVGGIVSYNRNGKTVEDCLFDGQISGVGDTGGVTGWNQGTVTRTLVKGTINQRGNTNCGGIASLNMGTISYCVVDATIEGMGIVGGIAGGNGSPNNLNAVISNCYVRGSVTGTTTTIGGLAGQAYANFENSYSTARVNGPESFKGGMVGRFYSGTSTNSYWNTETSGVPNSVLGTGRLTRQMAYPYDEVTYVDWDFDEIWQHDMTGEINDGYPLLFWQDVAPPLDIPEVTISIITVEGEDNSKLFWEPIDGAQSYKIYATDNPTTENWGMPIDVVAEHEFIEPIRGTKRFYKVVASSQLP